MDYYDWAIVGVCVSIGVCIVALIVFVVVFCRVRIKDDTNIRKRVITKNAFAEDRKEEIVVPRTPTPPPIIVQPPPQPMPMPLPMPMMLPPQPPPMMYPRPTPQPPQPEPRVIIREIIRDNPAPAPVERAVRRRSWSGVNNDDWVLVKKIKKRRKCGRKVVSDDSDTSSGSSDEEETVQQRPMRPNMVPMAYGVQRRMAPYDLAAPMRQPQSAMFNMVPASQPMMMSGLPTAQSGYVSVLMPQ